MRKKLGLSTRQGLAIAMPQMARTARPNSFLMREVGKISTMLAFEIHKSGEGDDVPGGFVGVWHAASSLFLRTPAESTGVGNRKLAYPNMSDKEKEELVLQSKKLLVGAGMLEAKEFFSKDATVFHVVRCATWEETKTASRFMEEAKDARIRAVESEIEAPEEEAKAPAG